jgi:hypothetical protein
MIRVAGKVINIHLKTISKMNVSPMEIYQWE